jgi:hypothetical protein
LDVLLVAAFFLADLLLLAFLVLPFFAADDLLVLEELFTAGLLVDLLEELCSLLLRVAVLRVGLAVRAFEELLAGFLNVLVLFAGFELLDGCVLTADLLEFPSPLLTLPLGETGSVLRPLPWLLPTFF